ncbi:hypothetical protein BT63DRAFT_454139 [Microthyrium microscopicum]|uniref:Uncharacterized protein n=1 Tax=Microthyrium microscopicum TaxID=703497 RepID=A0A6A6UCG2_9PEZI|nr:hypothetical protein BT63DRAFT_454139 [Microthyrium microscopicum]
MDSNKWAWIDWCDRRRPVQIGQWQQKMEQWNKGENGHSGIQVIFQKPEWITGAVGGAARGSHGASTSHVYFHLLLDLYLPTYIAYPSWFLTRAGRLPAAYLGVQRSHRRANFRRLLHFIPSTPRANPQSTIRPANIRSAPPIQSPVATDQRPQRQAQRPATSHTSLPTTASPITLPANPPTSSSIPSILNPNPGLNISTIISSTASP